MKFSAFLALSCVLVGTGCAATSSSEGAPPVGEDDYTQAPNFKGTGAQKDVLLDGHASKLVPVSAEIAALVKEMTAANTFQNNAFYAGVFTSTPASLAVFSSPANS